MRLGKDVKSDDNMNMRRVSWAANTKAVDLAREALGYREYEYRRVSPKAKWVVAMKGAPRPVVQTDPWDDDRDRKPFSQVAFAVCKYYEISKTDMTSNRRHKHLALARQMVMYIARQLTGMSMPEIGRRLGNRDHTTVLHGYRRIEGLLKDDPHVVKAYQQIMASINGS